VPELPQPRNTQTNFHDRGPRHWRRRRSCVLQLQLLLQRKPFPLRVIPAPAVGRQIENLMKLENSETKTRLLQRLHRIEGQVRGIGNMLEGDRECRDIVQQVTAIQSALLGFRELLLEEYALTCLLPAEDAPPDRRAQEQTLRELIHMLNNKG